MPSECLTGPTTIAVIPALNEASSIANVIERAKPFVRSVIVIDGGSTDGTPIIAAQHGSLVVEQIDSGKGPAMIQAMRFIDADIVVFLDADGQDPPETIPSFVRAILNGADVAKGSRYLRGGEPEEMIAIRRLFNAFTVVLVNALWSTKYTDMCLGLMALGRRARIELAKSLTSRGFEIETEISIVSKELGLGVIEIPVRMANRRRGSSKLNYFAMGWRMFELIIRMFVFHRVFSHSPANRNVP